MSNKHLLLHSVNIRSGPSAMLCASHIFTDVGTYFTNNESWSGIYWKVHLSVISTVLLSQLMEYEQMENVFYGTCFCKERVENSEKYYFLQKEKSSAPAPSFEVL